MSTKHSSTPMQPDYRSVQSITHESAQVDHSVNSELTEVELPINTQIDQLHQLHQPQQHMAIQQVQRIHGNQHVQRQIHGNQYMQRQKPVASTQRQSPSRSYISLRKEQNKIAQQGGIFAPQQQMFLQVSINIIIDKLADVTHKNADKKNMPKGKGKEVFHSHITHILDEAIRQGVHNENHLAYMLATALHESNMGLDMAERGGRNYTKKYIGKYGNKDENDAYNYRGKGYAHTTYKDNYATAQQFLKKQFNENVDLVNDPDILVRRPDIASKVLVYGMRTGKITGAKLSRYDKKDGSFDFREARRTINSLDDADKIAANAKEYLSILRGQ